MILCCSIMLQWISIRSIRYSLQWHETRFISSSPSTLHHDESPLKPERPHSPQHRWDAILNLEHPLTISVRRPRSLVVAPSSSTTSLYHARPRSQQQLPPVPSPNTLEPSRRETSSDVAANTERKQLWRLQAAEFILLLILSSHALNQRRPRLHRRDRGNRW